MRGTLVPCTTVGGPLTTTVDEIPESSETSIPSISEGTSPSVTLPARCGEASSTALASCSETPVPDTTVGDLSATTVDGTSSPSEILISSAPEMTEGTNPSVTVSVWCGEASSAALRLALFEGVSPSSTYSVKYDEASSVARSSERAEHRKPSLHAVAAYDEASLVVPRSELENRFNHRVRSLSVGNVDTVHRVLTLFGTVELSAGVANSASESLQSPEYTVH
jgi:hypothetical protein